MANLEKEENGNAEVATPNASHFPPLTIDWDLFAKYLEGSDAPEDEKKELVETVFAIMVSFVDLGFGIESTQRAMLAGRSDPASASLPFSDAVEPMVDTSSEHTKCAETDKRNLEQKGDKE